MDLREMLAKYQAFIFDFDGVVVDSLGIKAEAFAQLFNDLGPQVMTQVKEYHLSHGGVSRYDKFQYFFKAFRGRDITESESAALDRQFSQIVMEKVIAAPAIPGVMEFLPLLKKCGKFCFVVSATPEEEIRQIVAARGLASFFNEVVGSPRSKKENVGLVIQKNWLNAREVVYFGDAKSDYEAARAFGVDFVGVGDASGSELANIAGILRIKDFSL